MVLQLILFILFIIFCFVGYYLLPSNIMGICLPFKSKKSIESGTKCEYDCDCKSSACGRATAADNAGKICTASVIRYAGFDYSNKMKKNDTCWSDAMCGGVGGDKYCRGNDGGLSKGKCGKLELGEKCDIDNNCRSKHCSRMTAADNAPKVCATSGTRFGSFDYSKDMKKGDTCWSDAMCGGEGGGNYCAGNVGGTKKGKCGKLELGEKCNISANCKSGKCSRATADDNAPKICATSTTEYGGFDYSKQMKKGDTCWSDAMCGGEGGSNYCKGNAGGTRKGKCGKLEIGELSDKDANCKSGSAGRMDNNNSSKTKCCPSGKLTMNSRDFCKKVIPSGQKCTRATQCISDSCKGNMSGMKEGKCK